MAKSQEQAAKEFADYWKGRGYEKGESQSFWLSLLHDVYGVEHPEQFISFEEQVHLDNTSFIDAMIPKTKVMIEQKGYGKDLRKSIRQSDGTLLTPFRQAKRYITELPLSKHPRWVVTCNFSTFLVYDMERPGGEPEEIKLEDLPEEYYRLQFLVNTGEEHLKREEEISVKAGSIVGQLYDAFAKEYVDPDSKYTLHSLNVLCVRLVFCLYAENAGIFGKYDMFHDYLDAYETRDMRLALMRLFQFLDTPEDKRDSYLIQAYPDLAAFPYVNGGLFSSQEDIEIPNFTEEIRELLLVKASEGFNWSEISPTIFGAVFESTLNPETRRSGGMHYTSVENIHKVIDPLFLDDLKNEFDDICGIPVWRTRKMKLQAFQRKLASLTFLDPACGSGNFLTETYLSLRRLENNVLRELARGQSSFTDENWIPILVSLNQFYGIEINDFAVTVAKTALWIAESQMMKETESIILVQLDFLPLKSYTNIVEGNALQMKWENVVPKYKLNYIMGNPPFIGARIMSQGSKQKQEVQKIFGNIKDVQDLDYVTCWYKLAAQMMQGTKIEACFVSTNSICQGVQVPILWNVLFNSFHIHINFAYQNFKWESESSEIAAVVCVIIGFATFERSKKVIYSTKSIPKAVENISPYLVEGQDTYVTASKESLCSAPKMIFGNQPRDGGNFILSEEECLDILKREPALKKWIHPYMGADEFIKGKKRYCLWLAHADPEEIKQSKILYEKVEAVRNFRLSSKAKTTNGYAKVPNCFAQMTQPEGQDYLLIPSVSSDKRRYIPIGFMSSDIISSNLVYIVPGATLFHFGVLTSNVHMSWVRAVCGRLGTGYRYSKEIVYNTFPWPEVSDKQRQRIEETAQAILDTRQLYPQCSLASLYDDNLMPSELLKAHYENNKAVMAAYGWTSKDEAYNSESACVAELMKMYQKLTENEK